MKDHQFAIGDEVAYAEQRFPAVVWKADYRVVAELPSDEHGRRYAIRCAAPVFDRVVRQQELLHLPEVLTLPRPVDSCVHQHGGHGT
jgi:hypothetical protein